MLKNDTLKNGTSCIGIYGSAPSPAPGFQFTQQFRKYCDIFLFNFSTILVNLINVLSIMILIHIYTLSISKPTNYVNTFLGNSLIAHQA